MFEGSCDCSTDYDGPEEGDFHPEMEWRTARKTHVCGECKRTIQRGERYELAAQCNDGKWFHHKTCLGCYRIRMCWQPGGWYWGCVAESVAACIGFNYVTGEENPY